MVDRVQCAHCGRLYYEANQLNQILNVCLAVALFMLGCAGATYWETIQPTPKKMSNAGFNAP